MPKLDATIESALKNISKDLDTSIVTLNSQKIVPIERLPSGSLGLDLAMGGGWAKGRIHEVYGPEQTGKTMLSLFAIAEAQKQGMACAFVDVEHAFNPAWAKAIGVNLDRLAFSQPDYGEQALNVVARLTETGKFGVVVLDSIAALLPKSELEGEIGDNHMALAARMMGQALRKLTPSLARTGTVAIFINQLRNKVGLVFGNPETTSGGNALKYYASVRLDVRKVSKSDLVDAEKNRIGHDQRVKVVKNKVGIPYREAVVPIAYATGVRVIDDIINAAQETKLLNAEDGIAVGDKKFKNMADLSSALYADPNLVNEVAMLVRQKGGI